jgi:hypothetical protein
MRSRVVKILEAQDAVAVENPVHPGTPDVNYIEGWIELKHVDQWPANELTPLLIPHFTPQQRVWMMRRSNRGGRVHMLLQVGKEWLLFEGKVAAQEVGKARMHRLHALAKRRWKLWEDVERELLSCLSAST